MLRVVLTLILIAWSTDLFAAQSRTRTPASRQEDNSRRRHREPPAGEQVNPRIPLPTIGLPLPTIGLPHRPTGLPPLTVPAPTVPPPTLDRSDAWGRPGPNGRRGRRVAVPVLVPVPVFVPDVMAGAWVGTTPPAAPPVPAPVIGTGRVLFDVKPTAAAQIYVDGGYVGTPEDFRLGLELPAGPHVVEVQAAGFQSDIAPLNITDDTIVRHQVTLATAAAAKGEAAPTDTPTPPASTYYFIRGCYLGNVPPADAKLPAGCDPKSAVVVRP